MEINAHPVTAPHGLALYERSLQALCDFSMEPAGGDAAYSVHVRGYHCGSILISRATLGGARFRFHRTLEKVTAAGVDACAITVSLAGGERTVLRGEARTLRAGDAYLVDLTRPGDVVTDGGDNLQITVPRDLLGSSEAELDRLHGRILSANSAAGAMLTGYLVSLWAVIGHVRRSEADLVAQTTIGLIGNLLRGHKDEPGITPAVETSVIRRVHLYIAQNLAIPELDAAHLSMHFGLSRAALYRLFAPTGGVAAHIRQQRLRQAVRALSDRTTALDSLTRLARDVGFTNLASFNRAFKARYGMSPKTVRDRVLQSTATLELDSVDDAHWVGYWRDAN